MALPTLFAVAETVVATCGSQGIQGIPGSSSVIFKDGSQLGAVTNFNFVGDETSVSVSGSTASIELIPTFTSGVFTASIGYGGNKIISFLSGGIEKAHIDASGNIRTTGNLYVSGAATFASSIGVNTDRVITIGSTPLSLNGYSDDGASAVGIILNNAKALSVVGSKLVSIRNNSFEKAYIDASGAAYFRDSLTLYDSARSASSVFSFISPQGTPPDLNISAGRIYLTSHQTAITGAGGLMAFIITGGSAQELRLGNALGSDGGVFDFQPCVDTTKPVNIRNSRIANSSSAVAFKFGSANTLSSNGAKIISFYNDNLTSERAYVGVSGNAWLSSSLSIGNNISLVSSQNEASLTCWSVSAWSITGNGNIQLSAWSGGSSHGIGSIKNTVASDVTSTEPCILRIHSTNTFTTSSAKLVEFWNGDASVSGTRKAYIDASGSMWLSSTLSIDGNNVTNRQALSINNVGAGSSILVVSRTTGPSLQWNDAGSRFQFRTANWGGMDFNAAGNINNVTSSALFRFTGDTLAGSSSIALMSIQAATASHPLLYGLNNAGSATFQVHESGNLVIGTMPSGTTRKGYLDLPNATSRANGLHIGRGTDANIDVAVSMFAPDQASLNIQATNGGTVQVNAALGNFSNGLITDIIRPTNTGNDINIYERYSGIPVITTKGTTRYVGIGNTSPGAMLEVKSADADGASAVAMIVDTSASWSTSGAKLLSLRNATSEKLYISKDGYGYFDSGNTVLGGANNEISIRGGSGGLHHTGATLVLDGYGSSGLALFSRAPDGASAVGTAITTRVAYSTAGAKLLSIQNNLVEKAYIDKDGGAWFSGSVGIANQYPLRNIDVNGSGAFTGDVAANNLTLNGGGNWLPYSEDFSIPPWATTSSIEVVPSAALAPDGTNTATKLNETEFNAFHSFAYYLGGLYPSNNSVNRVYSIYAKAAERSRLTIRDHQQGAAATFDLSSSSVVGVFAGAVTASITPVSGGWYRCAVYLTSSAYKFVIALNSGSQSDYNGYQGVSGSGLYIWGAQITYGDKLNAPYVKTTGSVVTTYNKLLIENGNIGVGVSAPQAIVHLNSRAGPAYGPYNLTSLSSTLAITNLPHAGVGPEILLQRVGYSSDPAVIQLSAQYGNGGDLYAGYSIGHLRFSGYTSGAIRDGASILAQTEANWSGTDNKTFLSFATHNGTSNVERLRIKSDGTVQATGEFWRTSNSFKLVGGQSDSAASVGTILDTSASFVTTGAKLLSIRNATLERAYVDKDGGAWFSSSVSFNADSGLYKPAGIATFTLSSADNGVTKLHFQGAGDRGDISADGQYNITIEPNQTYGGTTGRVILRPKNGVDGATAISTIIDTSVMLTASGARLLSVRNSGSEKFFIESNGNTTIGPSVNSGSLTIGAAPNASTIDARIKILTPINTVVDIINAGEDSRGGGMRIYENGGGDVRVSLTTRAVATITERLVVRETGRVGINTLTPAAALHAVSVDTDGASAVAAVVDTSATWSNSGAKLLSIRNATSEKAYVDKDGCGVFTGVQLSRSYAAGTGGGLFLLGNNSGDAYNSLGFGLDSARGEFLRHYRGNNTAAITGGLNDSYANIHFMGGYQDNTILAAIDTRGIHVGKIRGLGGSSGQNIVSGNLTLQGTQADGGSSVGVIIDTESNYATSGAKLLSVRNSGTEKAYIDRSGTIFGLHHYGTRAAILAAYPSSTRQIVEYVGSEGNIASGSGNFWALDSGQASTYLGFTVSSGVNITPVLGAGTHYYPSIDVISTQGIASVVHSVYNAGGNKFVWGKRSITTPVSHSYENFTQLASLGVDGIFTATGGIGTDASVRSQFYYGAHSGLPVQLYGQRPDGNNIAVIVNNTVTLTSASAKLLSIQNNSVEKLWINKDGRITFDASSSVGVPGAATINKPAGQVAISASTSATIVTNSCVSTSSVVYAVIQQDPADATLTYITRVVPASGSFTIYGNGTASSAVQVGFVVFN